MKLNPNITKTVAFLNNHGFKTAASSGGKYDENDAPYPYVIVETEAANLIRQSLRLEELFTKWGIEVGAHGEFGNPPQIVATYDPVTHAASIELMYVDDSLFTKE